MKEFSYSICVQLSTVDDGEKFPSNVSNLTNCTCSTKSHITFYLSSLREQ